MTHLIREFILMSTYSASRRFMFFVILGFNEVSIRVQHAIQAYRAWLLAYLASWFCRQNDTQNTPGTINSSY